MAKMHRSHFVLIADIIADLPVTEDTRAVIASRFANALRGTNPAFNSIRFVAASLGEPETSATSSSNT